MEQSFDARGIEPAEGIDARRFDDGLAAPACPECGTPLRASGPGRRPVYCGRGCSSKAYRRRRAEGQQEAIAEALVSSRVDMPDAAEGGAQELLDLAASVRRSAARYLERLEEARQGGPDPGASLALGLLEKSVTSVTQSLLRKAHVLRHEMVVARLGAALPGGAVRAGISGVPAAGADGLSGAGGVLNDSARVGSGGGAAGSAVPASPASAVALLLAPDSAAAALSASPAGASGEPLSSLDAPIAPATETTRVESGNASAAAAVSSAQAGAIPLGPVAPAVPAPRSTASGVPAAGLGSPAAETTRVESSSAAVESGHSPDSTRVESDANAATPGVTRVSTRVETSGAGTGPATTVESARVDSADPPSAQPDTAGSPQRLRLALASESTSTAPFLRGLGVPTSTWSSGNGAFLIEGWDDRNVFAVRRRDRQLAGWVETSGSGWAAFVDGRAVIDSEDGVPWLAEDETYAVSLLTMALDQLQEPPA